MALTSFFSDPAFMPHGMCFVWQPAILATHVGSDVVIALSYLAISLFLFTLVSRRDDLVHPWVLHLFAAFILLCGASHAVGAWVVWVPEYGLEGLVKVATAAVSAATAIIVWPLLPGLLRIPSAARLRQVNLRLAVEVEERATAERKLQDTQAHLRAVLDTASDGIVACDPEGRLTFYNAVVRRLYGLPDEAGATIGLPEHPQVLGADGETPLGARDMPLSRALRGEEVQDAELVAVEDDGARRHYLASGRQMRDETGHVFGAVVSLHDDTERRRRREQERKVQAQRMEAVGRLTGGIAHDFNNLFTILLGNAQRLAHIHRDDARTAAMARRIEDAVKRGAGLTASLLAFSGRQVLQNRPLDLREQTQRSLPALRSAAGDNVALHLVMEDGLCTVDIDPGQLEAALTSLVTNAREAMPKGGVVTVAATNRRLADPDAHALEVKPGDYVEMRVTDTGHGMTAATMAEATEPFFSTKPPEEGAGLGLSMVYGFLRQSGGGLRLESDAGGGTTVHLYLPCTAPAGSAEAPARGDTRRGSGDDAVLVVEDDPDVRELAAAALEPLGCRVLLAAGIEEAVRTAEREPGIRVLFSDVVMDGGPRGVALARRLREALPGLGIVLASGYALEAIESSDDLPPGTVFVPKPYDLDELTETVRRMLNQASS